ncbi:unnamed protein product [Arctogadus glacialis]
MTSPSLTQIATVPADPGKVMNTTPDLKPACLVHAVLEGVFVPALRGCCWRQAGGTARCGAEPFLLLFRLFKCSAERPGGKDESGKPQDRTEDDHNDLAVPLRKKKVARAPNGLTLDPCKNNHHHTHQYHNLNRNRHNHNHLPSDQENNNPRLTHTAGKRKKKHLHKKHTAVSLMPALLV